MGLLFYKKGRGGRGRGDERRRYAALVVVL